MLVELPQAMPAATAVVTRDLVTTAFLVSDAAHRDVEVHVRGIGRPVIWWLRCDDVACDPYTGLFDVVAGARGTVLRPCELDGMKTSQLRHGIALLHRRKASIQPVADRLGTMLHRQQDWRRRSMSGRTYHGVPRIARVQAGTRFLVTIKMPIPPERADWYPRTWRYRKTAPVCTFTRWQDELLHVAAHEARHVVQMDEGLPLSEVDAERHAVDVAYMLARAKAA